MSYTPIEGVLDASWVGSAPYAPPITIAVGDWREGFASVYPAGFRSSEFGAQFVTKQQFVDPLGWEAAVYGTALGTLNWQYIPPYAAVDALWAGASSYTPPVSPLTAIWVVGPPSEDISVYGTGFESSVFGEHLVWRPQFVSPDGLDTARFGQATAYRDGDRLHADWSGSPLYAPYEGWAFALWKVLPEGAVWAYGFDHSRFSSAPHVWNKRQYIKPPGAFTESFGGADLILTAQGASVHGIAPPPQTGPNSDRQIPSPFIDFRTRHLMPGGIAVPTNQIATTHVIAPDIQFIDLLGRGPNPWATGNARIEYAVRYVEPPFIVSNIFGSHNVARIQVAAPSGWESSFISENHEFDINLQRLFHHSGEADPAGYGATHVRNQHEELHPTGWLSQNINFPVVYNLDQYLFVQPYMDTNSDPTQWPPYSPFVENKIRTLGPGGWQSSRFSVIGNIVENTATPLLPSGLDATLWGPETFIAHRIRTVHAQGWDSFYNERYTVVWNKADVVGPAGVGGSSVFGRPSPVANLNREIKQHSGWVGPVWGVPFIAFARRFITPGLFYDVPASFPEVRHNPFPVEPVGIPWQGQVGGHDVMVFRREAFPKSANVHSVEWVGEPIVRNHNRTVAPYAYDQSLFGRPDIQNLVRYIAPEWVNPGYFTPPLIRYRTRTVHAAPITIPVFTVLHRVRKDSPDPPSQQLITLNALNGDGEETDGFGIAPPGIPVPAVNLATIYPIGIGEAAKFGTHKVHSNNITVRSVFEDGLLGVPTLAYTRYVYPTGRASTIEVPNGIRLTPWNIYAPRGDQTPPGYTPQTNLAHVIRSEAVFGAPMVTNQHRAIGPVPTRGGNSDVGFDFFPKFGTPTFTLRRQYVVPNGIRSQRFGQIIFLNVPQYVNLDDEVNRQGIAPSTQWGANVIAYPPIQPSLHRPVYPVGLNATLWGTHRVEPLHRTITVSGIPHRGNPESPMPYSTSPWGIALVGYPRRYTIGMGVQTLWGNNLIEFKNRPVYPVGWNSCSLEDGNFDDYRFPMEVIRKNPLVRPASMGDVTVFGTCTVSQLVRTVYARGVDSYNGGSHYVKASSTIGAQGWESLLIGDIDRWEAGKIKAHGDDMSTVGTPRLLHPLRASGFDGGVVVAPRIAPVVSPVGVPNIAFDGPSVTDPFGCTNRVMSPLPIMSSQTVPSPAVA